MNKCEALLLEHADAVVNLLNGFMLKDISSQHVLQRLDYLYDKLHDFLVKKLCANHEPTDSDPWQQGGNLAVTKDKEFEAPVPSMGTVENVEYVCGLCRSPITIYNSDHKLSMDLHYQDDVHQKAVKIQKMRRVQAVIPKPDKPTKQLQKINVAQTSIPKTGKCTELQKTKGAQAMIPKTGKHTDQLQKMKGAQTMIQKIGKSTEQLQNMKGAQATIPKTGKPTEINCKYISHTSEKYHCCLCNMNMASQKCVYQHVSGATHQKNLAALQTDHSEDAYGTLTADMGMFYHQVCGVPVGCSSSAVQHKWGKANLQKLLRQPVPSKEDKFWSKIPEGWRNHRKYFVDLGATALQCSACSVSVPKTTINVLSHIRGKKHCHVSSDSM
jgi:hypothetical protein